MLSQYPNVANPLKMEVRCWLEKKVPNISYYFQVGIEDSLHIEFEYNKARYHVEEAIIGKLYFIFQSI